MKNYDVIIIGSGGGTKLRPAADLGKKVAIIEKEGLGGTCLNRGCIPSKMLIYPADLVTHVREDISKYEIKADTNFEVDFEKLVTRVTEEVTKDSASIAPGYEKHPNIDLYRGHAKFVENKVIEVNGEKLTAEKIYIATGTRPQIPNIQGLEGTPYMTSREALRHTKLPKKMIVIGGGYIAVELGHVYGALGTDVHFLVRSSMIKAEDKDIRSAFEENFSERYNVHMGTSPTKVAYENGAFQVTVKNKEGEESVMTAESLFVATGVVPNSDDLGLEHTDIKTDERGYIKANDYLETSVSGVYTLGDVLGNYLFRHSVNFEGEYLLGQHHFNLPSQPIQYPPVPHAIFSYPQIAGVGVTEDELIKSGKVAGTDYVTSTHHYKNSGMGMAMLPDVGFVKLIAEKSSRKLIGAHIIGEKSSDIIHMLILAITKNCTADELLEMIYIHPALSEVIRNAVRKLVVGLQG